MNSASLSSLAGQYDNPLPPRFLAPIDSLKFQLWLVKSYVYIVQYLWNGETVAVKITKYALYQTVSVGLLFVLVQ